MKILCAALGLCMVVIAGCGSGGTHQTTPVTGAVADGYLQNATVFLDRNSNYQLDQGEPSTTTDQNGAYVLSIAAGEVGRYPVVAVAVKGQTIDKDTGLAVTGSYVLCLPGAAISGTVSNFISPMSTLIREKMAANPGLSLAEAITQLRNQLNLPVGINVLGDYIAGGTTGLHGSQYQTMHQVARQMTSLMATQADLVVSGTGAYHARFRGMMGQINQNLPLIVDNVNRGLGMESTFMQALRSGMYANLAGTPVSAGYGSFSSLFRNTTSHTYFWRYSSGTIQPLSRMMGGGMRR